jgi:energy-coupling factor transport system ATP-binding protein
VGVKSEFLEKSPFDLSGGEKRRVAIAGVMAMKPQVIVFDEPTAGLDPKGREDVANIIQNYRKATDATVIIISHSMEDMAEVADKILVMNEGKLMFFDTPKEIFSKETELSEMGLNVPIVTRVFGELEKMGINIPYKPLTVGEAVKLLEDLKGEIGNA